jgi:tripartite-type tricarboxylate transporter receptor subunit TctC
MDGDLMNSLVIRTLPITALAACLVHATHAAHAQTYPVRPVRVVAASAPGGTSDILARLLAQRLTETFKQQFVVENRAGASGILGTDAVAKAPPDGHTLLLIQPSLTINPSIFAKLPYDTVNDLAPITNVVDVAQCVTVHPSVPAKSVKELIALAKARPGVLVNGTPGAGTHPHLTSELFQQSAGIRLQMVAYKGVSPALVALVSGEVGVAFSAVPSALPYIQSGKIRVLGVTTARPLAALPGVPAITESGLPGFVSSQWFGMLATAGTPRAVIERLHQAITRAAGSAEMKDKLSGMGMTVINSTPEEFAATIRSELDTWAKVIKAANIKPQ